ncbi:hypothetical protein AV530_010321 [Patagioenas fasciata monilis]|uniref:Uncharacterized protein n=1 Tax=Patagioenas fasciata monilis TaxID=372326 RepID=A0A1V4KED4_PATFA|nr:hypothetical protein AV530_010321 [Patagioenas fasciata monilis]
MSKGLRRHQLASHLKFVARLQPPSLKRQKPAGIDIGQSTRSAPLRCRLPVLLPDPERPQLTWKAQQCPHHQSTFSSTILCLLSQAGFLLGSYDYQQAQVSVIVSVKSEKLNNSGSNSIPSAHVIEVGSSQL